MEIKNPVLYLINILVLELKDILVFPLWWYSRGFWNLLLGLKDFLSNAQKSLGLFVWIKNIFVPMYGQGDFSGKIISFFVRLFQIFFRGVFLVIILCFACALVILWLALPAFIIWQIFFQFNLVESNFFI